MAGLLGDRLDRVHLVATGCLLWAACTAAIGMSTTLTQVCALQPTPCRGCPAATGLLGTKLGHRLPGVGRMHRRHRNDIRKSRRTGGAGKPCAHAGSGRGSC